ncbi:predicted protein [Plenodomus lingam JN3]|uniref:Predicted protein n=1 Tax=Leptosphaeria maculans (strain JN3 / isolate v23.1.3 / race Av1-4-5-6-7-8) TaxID=985895 RepID=E4ZP08_LEPMJ|nr:predicted protein [Plenodomus lingam JN3]CBX93377.1 predicted protein [Plenodomus lingam JN3]
MSGCVTTGVEKQKPWRGPSQEELGLLANIPSPVLSTMQARALHLPLPKPEAIAPACQPPKESAQSPATSPPLQPQQQHNHHQPNSTPI